MRGLTIFAVTSSLALVCAVVPAHFADLVPSLPRASAGPALADSTATRVDAAVRRQRTKRTRFAVGIWDAKTGKPVARHHADRVLRPASVMKLATTGAALLRLAPDDAFTTDVYVDWRSPRDDEDGDGKPTGEQRATRLKVVGSGDPGLSGRFHDGDVEAPLRKLAQDVAQRLKSRGVTQIEGDLVLDTSAFEGPARHPTWGWKPGAYEWWRAPVTALILNDNCLDIRAMPGPKVGGPGQLSIAPENDVARFSNQLVTVANRKDHSIRFLAPKDGVIPVRGGVLVRSSGYEKSLVLTDPAQLFGSVFRRLLLAEGITITGNTEVLTSERRVVPGGPFGRLRRERIGRHTTKVSKVVDVANTRSQNLFSEVLLRRLGLRFGGGGAFEHGAEVVRTTFGFEPDGPTFRQVDGSGLSRDNQATVGAIGRILLRLYDSPQRNAFMGSLALGGSSSGTLRKRFKAERFAGRVRAKTGTLRDTTALAGYVRSLDGRIYAFAVLCEGSVGEGRRLQDAVVDALVGR